MVMWYGFLPMNTSQHLEEKDKWCDPDGTWHEWTGNKWKEIVSDQV